MSVSDTRECLLPSNLMSNQFPVTADVTRITSLSTKESERLPTNGAGTARSPLIRLDGDEPSPFHSFSPGGLVANGSNSLERLNALLELTWERNPFYKGKWRRAGLRQGGVDSIEALADFPLTTRDEIQADQAASPPLGTNLSASLSSYRRIHRSSGTTLRPIYWADTSETWSWILQCSLALYAISGVQAKDRLLLAAQFGASSGPCIMYEGACALGCCCVNSAADTDHDVSWIEAFRPTVLIGKTQRVLALAERLRKHQSDPSKLGVEKVITTGAPGAGVVFVRQRLEQLWRAECFDRYGMTEAGSIASECTAHQGVMHVLDEAFVTELIDPESGQPARDGDVGELILTNLGRTARPIIRYRTGDLVCMVRRYNCACGRSGPVLVGPITRKGNT
jgi:phenylacetate-CoA ligase